VARCGHASVFNTFEIKLISMTIFISCRLYRDAYDSVLLWLFFIAILRVDISHTDATFTSSINSLIKYTFEVNVV
jgi:hypothetical protein